MISVKFTDVNTFPDLFVFFLEYFNIKFKAQTAAACYVLNLTYNIYNTVNTTIFTAPYY